MLYLGVFVCLFGAPVAVDRPRELNPRSWYFIWHFQELHCSLHLQYGILIFASISLFLCLCIRSSYKDCIIHGIQYLLTSLGATHHWYLLWVSARSMHGLWLLASIISLGLGNVVWPTSQLLLSDDLQTSPEYRKAIAINPNMMWWTRWGCAEWQAPTPSSCLLVRFE